ncbi:MerR family transcriptional regulator [Arthrobacter sp. JZ12]|uniref:MerR family transcriptional regulator n=1 Tax=Arthrobacter sp. JZ12 TaxID=2654190 RepID=UPI002B45FAEB|nr:MerR family transcriptional regulator [Arthrobacter sp. JZ12]WRH26153.1 MerR family transcriptional regulator [Arthrobacter sp. JZ12]
MDRSIQEVSRLAGTTSRTLRHYDRLGLLPPSRIGGNGYRYYDDDALVRLQRILLLRDLGLGLPAIAEVLGRSTEPVRALRKHLEWLRQEQDRLARQVASVSQTIERLEGGEELMAEDMFDGFDHTQYKDEVEERWGKEAYAASNRWWNGLDADEQGKWKAQTAQLGADWTTAAQRGIAPDSPEAQELAQRHYDWLAGVPGLPSSGSGPGKEYLVGLGEMYVSDDRFAANYGGRQGAEFVRDALRIFADRSLQRRP